MTMKSLSKSTLSVVVAIAMLVGMLVVAAIPAYAEETTNGYTETTETTETTEATTTTAAEETTTTTAAETTTAAPTTTTRFLPDVDCTGAACAPTWLIPVLGLLGLGGLAAGGLTLGAIGTFIVATIAGAIALIGGLFAWNWFSNRERPERETTTRAAAETTAEAEYTTATAGAGDDKDVVGAPATGDSMTIAFVALALMMITGGAVVMMKKAKPTEA